MCTSWRALFFVASVSEAVSEEYQQDASPFERWISRAAALSSFSDSLDNQTRASSSSNIRPESISTNARGPTPYDIAVCFTGIPVSSNAGPSAKRFVFDVLRQKIRARTGVHINIDVFFVTEAGSHEELANDFGFFELYEEGMVKSAVHELNKGEKMFDFFDVYEPRWRFRLKTLEGMRHSMTAWDGPKPFFVDHKTKQHFGEKGARTAEMGALHVYQDFMCHELMRVEETLYRAGGLPYHSVILSRSDLLWLYDLPVPPLLGPDHTRPSSGAAQEQTRLVYFDTDFLLSYHPQRQRRLRFPGVEESRDEYLALRRRAGAGRSGLQQEGEACWSPSVRQHDGYGIQLFFWYCTRSAAEVALTKRLEQFFRPSLFWNQVDAFLYNMHLDLAKTLAHWRVPLRRFPAPFVFLCPDSEEQNKRVHSFFTAPARELREGEDMW